MLNINLIQDTDFYQKAKQDTKSELIPKLLDRGLSIQEVAELLEINVEVVREKVEAILDLEKNIQGTELYRSILKRTKFSVILILIEKELSIQEIAKSLELEVEEVRDFVEEEM